MADEEMTDEEYRREQRRLSVADAIYDEVAAKVDEYGAIAEIAPDLPDTAGHFQIIERLDRIANTLEQIFVPDGHLVRDRVVQKGELVRIREALERIAAALETK